MQGGEKHTSTGHSFVAESNYASALGREATRVVSCNTTSVVRTLTALERAGLLRRARGTLRRRAIDPWESHAGGNIDNQAIVIPETIDAIRALTGTVQDANESIAKRTRRSGSRPRSSNLRGEPCASSCSAVDLAAW